MQRWTILKNDVDDDDVDDDIDDGGGEVVECGEFTIVPV
jgi:hypothetical protein